MQDSERNYWLIRMIPDIRVRHALLRSVYFRGLTLDKPYYKYPDQELLSVHGFNRVSLQKVKHWIKDGLPIRFKDNTSMKVNLLDKTCIDEAINKLKTIDNLISKHDFNDYKSIGLQFLDCPTK